MGNVSRALVKHFEQSTAKVNHEEVRRVRRMRWRKAGIVGVLVLAFVAGMLVACKVRL